MDRIIWSPLARQYLAEIRDYIARDAPATARRFITRIIARVEKLAANPVQGGFIAEDSARRYREVLVGNYRIIFKLANTHVQVLAIRHAARLLDPDRIDATE